MSRQYRNPDGATPTNPPSTDPGNTVQIVGVKAGVILPTSAEKPQSLRAAEQAKVYFAGSGRITLGVAGNIRGTLGNPVAATDNIHIIRLAGLTSVVSWATLLYNPTAGLPLSAARRVNNNVLSLAGDSTVMKVDTDATTPLSGGTDLGVTLGLAAGHRFQVDLPVPIVLAPGASLGLAIPISGSGDVSFTMYWYRTPAA